MPNLQIRKLLRIMKIVLLFIGICTFGLSANTSYSQVTKVSLDLQEVSLKSLLNEIVKKTEFSFWYNNSIIEGSERITVTAKDLPINKLLDIALLGKNLKYEINDKIIYIYKPIPGIEDRESYQKFDFEGEITDSSTGEGLPGVNVVIEGTTIGVISDEAGKYKISAPSQNVTLIFSYVGYNSEKVSTSGRTVIDVKLIPDIKSLDEVVVVGYGIQKKVNLTGSVSTLSSKEIEGRPITNLSNALSGLSTGVQINQASGQPGRDGATIRIRGIGTWVDANPLILIDGVESSMSSVAPEDVENISVLKDAAASAIYGSRAANGVILITTKKGSKGKLKVNYHGYWGWQKATKIDDYVSDFAQYMELNNEANQNVGLAPSYTQTDIDAWRTENDPLFHPNINWIDKVYGNVSQMQSNYLSFSGGAEKSEYSFSLGYTNQEGITPKNKAKKYNFRLNWESAISKKWKIGTNISGLWVNINDPFVGEVFGIVPGIPWLQKEDGRWGGNQSNGTGTVMNPRAQWTNDTNEERISHFLGKVYLNWNILEGLNFDINGAIKYNNSLRSRFNAKYDLWNFNTDAIVRTLGDPQTASNNNSQDYTLTNYYTLNYSRKILGEHNINILLGSSIESFRNDQFQASIQKFHNNEIRVLSGGQINPQVNGNATEWVLVSYFGRMNYEYKTKYLFEANVRYDGSSRFKEGNRWDVYPSFSAGWRISEEEFMKNFTWINNLKLRTSWGTLGNQNLNSFYPYQFTYELNQNYSFGGNVASGIAQTTLTNPNIKWEKSKTTDFGIDFSTFNGKLNLEADYFYKTTEGILVRLPFPATMGDKTDPYLNLAEFKNNGWEINCSYRNESNNFKYSFGFNVTKVNNEVTKYNGKVPYINEEFIIREGLPLYTVYGYKNTGIIRTSEELNELNQNAVALTGPGSYYINNKTNVGDLKYEDQYTIDSNNDGIPDAKDGIINSSDRIPIGNTIPEFMYGINLNLEFKGFDLAALFQGVYNVDTYLYGAGVSPINVNGDRGQIPTRWLDRWTSDNPSASYPRLTNIKGYNYNDVTSSFWVHDASYIRLKSLQIGYTLPSVFKNLTKIERARIYANGENLLTYTKFKGWDPERSQRANQINSYPNVRTITLGLQMTF